MPCPPGKKLRRAYTKKNGMHVKARCVAAKKVKPCDLPIDERPKSCAYDTSRKPITMKAARSAGRKFMKEGKGPTKGVLIKSLEDLEKKKYKSDAKLN